MGACRRRLTKRPSEDGPREVATRRQSDKPDMQDRHDKTSCLSRGAEPDVCVSWRAHATPRVGMKYDLEHLVCGIKYLRTAGRGHVCFSDPVEDESRQDDAPLSQIDGEYWKTWVSTQRVLIRFVWFASFQASCLDAWYHVRAMVCVPRWVLAGLLYHSSFSSASARLACLPRRWILQYVVAAVTPPSVSQTCVTSSRKILVSQAFIGDAKLWIGTRAT